MVYSYYDFNINCKGREEVCINNIIEASLRVSVSGPFLHVLYEDMSWVTILRLFL